MVRQIGLFISVAAVLLVVPHCGLSADNLQFKGSLVAITPRSVWVREANGVLRFARLPDEGVLKAQTLAGQYKIGDQVLVKGFSIDRSRDDEEGEWFEVEATSLDYLRPPSAAELASALASPAWHRKPSLLRASASDPPTKSAPPTPVSLKTLQLPDSSMAAPDKNDPAVILERSRLAIQKYLAALPNFNADETSKRFSSPSPNPPKWQVEETLQSEVSFQGASAMHRNVVRNGEPWNDLFEHLPPLPRAGPQHGLLRSVFSANCATLEFVKRAVEAGVPVLVYRITAPPESCFGGNWGPRGQGARYFPGKSGEVTIAEADNLVRRLDVSSTGYPKGYGTELTETHATWDYIKIGEERHLLPVEVQSLLVGNGSGLSLPTLSVATFKNHRHFEAFTDIKYK